MILISINQSITAELTAILLALEIIFTLPQPSFIVFSDSLSALTALESFSSSHPLVLSILEWLFLIQRRGRHVEFCWVPAHVGVSGNERADRLAKVAASGTGGALPRYRLPASDFKSFINSSVRRCWQECWDSVGANKLRAICTALGSFQYVGLQRKWETTLCRLRIGHTRFSHEFLLDRSPPPFCEDCLVPLTVQHILVECPSFIDLRSQFLSRYRAGDGTYPLSSVLGEDACSGVGGTLAYLQATGFFGKV